jgi:hypothetical protein
MYNEKIFRIIGPIRLPATSSPGTRYSQWHLPRHHLAPDIHNGTCHVITWHPTFTARYPDWHLIFTGLKNAMGHGGPTLWDHRRAMFFSPVNIRCQSGYRAVNVGCQVMTWQVPL